MFKSDILWPRGSLGLGDLETEKIKSFIRSCYRERPLKYGTNEPSLSWVMYMIPMLVVMGSASSAAFPHMVSMTYHLLYSFQMFAKSCKKGCYLIHSSQAVIIHRMHVNDNWSCVNIQGRRSTGFLLSEPWSGN